MRSSRSSAGPSLLRWALVSSCLLAPALAFAQEPVSASAPAAASPPSEGAKAEEAKAEEAKPEEAKAEEAKPEEAPPQEEAEEPEAPSLKLKYGLMIQPDLRLRLEDKVAGQGYWDRIKLGQGVERNQNLLRGRFKASWGRFSGVAQADLVINGFGPEIRDLSGLSRIEANQPYRLDINNLYVEAKDVPIQGLDLRIGQMVIQWGEGDQFNPTNNLNPDDLRDPLLFGRQAGTFMIAADYWVNEVLSFQGVLVPSFRPALLPFTAPVALASIDRLPFADENLRLRVASEQGASQSLGYPTVVGTAKPENLPLSFENMQVGFKMALVVAEQDISLSYYNGRTDIPQPKANHTRQDKTPRCDPENPAVCVPGLLVTDVTLTYPRMHVYGLNMAGEFLGFGYRVEGALIVPEASTIRLTNDELDLFPINQSAGEYDYDNDGKPGGREALVVPRAPFLKWTLGLDRAVGEHVYLNGQWVHGLMDEYGSGDFLTPLLNPGVSPLASRGSRVTTDGAKTLTACALPRDGAECVEEWSRARLGDYAVLGADFKFLNEALLLRLFTIVDVTGYQKTAWSEPDQKRVTTSYPFFTEQGFSGVIYPEANYNFGNGLELAAGALFLIGGTHTKFGDPAAGGSLAFARARYSL